MWITTATYLLNWRMALVCVALAPFSSSAQVFRSGLERSTRSLILGSKSRLSTIADSIRTTKSAALPGTLIGASLGLGVGIVWGLAIKDTGDLTRGQQVAFRGAVLGLLGGVAGFIAGSLTRRSIPEGTPLHLDVSPSLNGASIQLALAIRSPGS